MIYLYNRCRPNERKLILIGANASFVTDGSLSAVDMFKMTRSDRPTTGDWLVIRKLRLLPRKTDSPTPPSRFQHRVSSRLY